MMGITARDRGRALASGWWTAMYNRTQNPNGSYDTRCLDCLLTIARGVKGESELDELEAHHLCPEKALAWLYAQQTATAPEAPAPPQPHK
jgi:hypothetical protein